MVVEEEDDEDDEEDEDARAAVADCNRTGPAAMFCVKKGGHGEGKGESGGLTRPPSETLISE